MKVVCESCQAKYQVPDERAVTMLQEILSSGRLLHTVDR